jgi:hypothetical protein
LGHSNNKRKKSFDVGSLIKDTLSGAILGATIGAGMGTISGFGGPKNGNIMIDVDENINNSTKQGTNKFVEGLKSYFKKLLTDERGSISLGSKNKTNGNWGAGRFAKKPLDPSNYIGTLDESFANLSTTKKIDAAFAEIENAFGKSYANKIRDLYNSTSRNFFTSSEDLGVFRLDVRGNLIIDINKNIGNSKVMANTILHEVRHLRQYNKLGANPKVWNGLSDEFVERFATSTNLWQGKRMGLSPEDMNIFENYYNGWRGK